MIWLRTSLGVMCYSKQSMGLHIPLIEHLYKAYNLQLTVSWDKNINIFIYLYTQLVQDDAQANPYPVLGRSYPLE